MHRYYYAADRSTAVGRHDGTRGSYNDRRTFFTPSLRQKFPAVQAVCTALQNRDVAGVLARSLNIDVSGGLVR